MVLSPKNSINKRQLLGLPWQSSGSGSKLAMQEMQVQSLVGELRSCMPHGVTPIASHPLPKKKQKQKKPQTKGQLLMLLLTIWGTGGKEAMGKLEIVSSPCHPHMDVSIHAQTCVWACAHV